ncbi:MAG: 1,4-beta-xylanase [Bryobacteraceae bacterium]
MRPWRIGVFLLLGLSLLGQKRNRDQRHWTEAEARQWYAREAWLVGANFIPSTASNELEMWQADTFDPTTIDRELGLAEGLGMNTVRVFLHYLVWREDAAGFERRINVFLKIAERHHIKTLFVLFDSCWDPFPEIGPQRPPQPGIHNSRWVQSPGAPYLMNPKEYDSVLAYVQHIIRDFGDDKRVVAWDLWNEPDNTNQGSYGPTEPANKLALVEALLPQVFTYARAGLPQQPLTTGLWHGDWSSPSKLTAIEKIQLDNSDIISFHSYAKPAEFEQRVVWLEALQRPILCTEYMARPNGSTFQSILPIAKKHNIGAYNWGLVAGKTQTYLPWDSWQKPYINRQPAVWFHDIFHPDGTPYSPEEVAFLHSILQREKAVKNQRAK